MLPQKDVSELQIANKFSSNAYTNKILDSIINQSQKSKTNKGRIDVIIEKRDVNKIPQIKNVEIKWKKIDYLIAFFILLYSCSTKVQEYESFNVLYCKESSQGLHYKC